MFFFLIFRDRERRKRPKGHIESSQHQSGIKRFINPIGALIVFFNSVVWIEKAIEIVYTIEITFSVHMARMKIPRFQG